MRNYEAGFRHSPKPRRIPGVGFTSGLPRVRPQNRSGTSPNRHFTPTATNLQAPKGIHPGVFDPRDYRDEVLDMRP